MKLVKKNKKQPNNSITKFWEKDYYKFFKKRNIISLQKYFLIYVIKLSIDMWSMEIVC